MRRLSEIQREALWLLIIFGPVSIAELSRRMQRSRQRVYQAMYQTQERGLAVRTGPRRWDATLLGRRTVEGLDRERAAIAAMSLFDTAEIGTE